MGTDRIDLVFEGGGAKGMVHIGAMTAFDELGLKHGRLVGTSAGAMTAGLLAAGFRPAELKAASLERVNGEPIFATFKDQPKADEFSQKLIKQSLIYKMLQSLDWSFIPNWLERRIDLKIISHLMENPYFRELFAFVERGGIYAGMTMYDWLRNELNKKKIAGSGKGLGDATLAEFNAATGVDLTVIATDTIGQQMLVLNHRTAPDCPAAWAVRMSMNIPFVWEEILWRDDWGPYIEQGVKHNITGHTIVDGGLVSNFALRMLVSTSPEVLDVMGQPTGNQVIGFKIDDQLAVPDAPPPPETDSNPLADSKVARRLERTLDTMMGAHNKFVVAEYPQDVCRLPAKGYGATQFDMSAARIEALINGGYTFGKAYLTKRFQ